MKYIVVSLLALVLVASKLTAQSGPSRRADDHFWKKRVVMRLDLQDKINKPLIVGNANFNREYVRGEDPRYQANTRGMVYALMNAWKGSKIVGYNGDTLYKTMDVATFEKKLQKFSGTLVPAAGEGDASTGEGDDTEFDIGEGDDTGFDIGEEDVSSTAKDETKPLVPTEGNYESLEYFVEFVEDRIFDRIRGEMVYKLKFIRLVLSHPEGTIPDENAVCFKFDDPIVTEILANTQYKNRFNDSEDKSIKDVLDSRQFTGIVSSVSGLGVNSVEEAETRRQQLIQFEHNLWSY